MAREGPCHRLHEALTFALLITALLHLVHDLTPPDAAGSVLDLRRNLRSPAATPFPLLDGDAPSSSTRSSSVALQSSVLRSGSQSETIELRTLSLPAARALSAAEATHATPTADPHAAAVDIAAEPLLAPTVQPYTDHPTAAPTEPPHVEAPTEPPFVEAPTEPPHPAADTHAATQPPLDSHQHAGDAAALQVPPTVEPHGTAPPEAPVETHVPEAALGVPAEVHEGGEGHESTDHEAGHGHETGHEHDHGAEHHFNPSEGGLSFTLICIVMISLVLFFFVNSEDADIVAYTWDLLGKGINVFVSVMIFLIVVEICETVWPNWTWAWCTGLMGAILIGLIFANLHSIRAYNELAIQPRRQRFVGEVNYNKITKKVIFSMTFGRIQAHLAAFTMIFFWGHIQHEIHYHNLCGGGGPWSVALVVPLAAAFHLLVMAALSFVRNRVAGLDGEVDEDERLWLRQCDEVDIEAGGLELAFLAMQVIRFALTGKMPTPNGNYHGRVPGDTEAWWLLGIAVLAGAGGLASRRILASQRAKVFGKKAAEESEDEEDGAPEKEVSSQVAACFAVLQLVVEFLSFLSGWSLFFTFEVLMKTWDAKGTTSEHEQDIMLIRTSVALMCSGVVFTIICCMDKIVDALGRGHVDVTKDAEVIISVVGMMMGFGWERCFHHAFEVASGGAVVVMHSKLGLEVLFSELGVFVLTCTVMSVATILVLFWYINPRSMESRAKAKFDKAFPGGLLRDDSLLSEQESVRDSVAESGVGGWLASMFGSRPPSQMRGMVLEAGSEQTTPRPRPKRQPVWTAPLPREESTIRPEETPQKALLTYKEEPQDTDEEPSYEAPVLLQDDPAFYSHSETDTPEVVPFPRQRMRQEEYHASVGMYGQAYWAPTAGPVGGPYGGPYGTQGFVGPVATMPPMGPPPGSLQMQPFVGPPVPPPMVPPGSLQPQPGLLPPTAGWQPSLAPGPPVMVPNGPYW